MSSMQIPPNIPAGMPPPGVKANLINPASLQSTTIGIGVVLQVLTTIFLGLRLLANSSNGRKLWWNDYACTAAWIFSTVSNALIMTISRTARNIWDTPLIWYDAPYFKIIYTITITLTLATFFAKNSMLLLYLRLFHSASLMKGLNMAIIGAMVFTIPLYAITIVLESYYCAAHGSLNWDFNLGKYCSHSSLYSVIQGVLNVILDFWIIALPISPILKLQLSTRRKIGILSIFATGLFAVASSTIAAVFRAEFHFNTNSVRFFSGALLLCLICEVNVIIICSCMPALATLSKTRLTSSSLFRSVHSFLRLSGDGSHSDKDESRSQRKYWPKLNRTRENLRYPAVDSDVELVTGAGTQKSAAIQHTTLAHNVSQDHVV